MNIQVAINQLLQYGLNHNLMRETDLYYSANRLIEKLGLKEFKKDKIIEQVPFQEILETILDYACEKNLIEDNNVARDLFDSEIMDCLMPRPSEVNTTFWENYQKDPVLATDKYYKLSQASNYIRLNRTNKNIKWKTKTAYGLIDITINLSKPEKDPKVIAMQKKMPKTGYPKCLLCPENEGYKGHLNHPGRANHRIIELNLNKEIWYLQYSPYVYYNEHCIVLKKEHVPMNISRTTFEKLFDFVEQFPHYFVGSNADLPIVGGSILAHEHFQGGRYEFTMMKQSVIKEFKLKSFADVNIGIVDWPMSVLRLQSKNKAQLIELSSFILVGWKNYSDEESDIRAYSGSERHNTITPIARMVEGVYEINLVLRNNRTTDEHPLGIFHPHKEHHHIKKENIGLIEVMGLAVLPARLKTEMEYMKDYLLIGKTYEIAEFNQHLSWLEIIKNKHNDINEKNVVDIIQNEIGLKFAEILSQCGVFKDLNSFMKFINYLEREQ